MLYRQRLIIALLERTARPIQATKLVKLAFLLRQETPVGQDCCFYSFVPYRFGPFSFALYRELSLLERDGYVLRGDHISLNPDTLCRSREEIAELSGSQMQAVGETVSTYGRMKWKTLVRSVYQRYPWYTLHSELSQFVPEDAPQPQHRPIAAYTIGYEGKSVDDFFNGLISSGMKAILDVRANPMSRKYGFSKKSMNEIAGKLGVAYHHIPELGIASEHRANLSNFDSYQRLLHQYEARMLPKQTAHIQRAINLLRLQPSVLFCVEKDVRCCHRGRLANRIATESGLAIVHL